MDENTQDSYPLTVRGRRIRVDEDGLFNLTDIWSAAGFKVNQKPAQWWRSPVTQKLAVALLERIFGNSPKAKVRVSAIFRFRGRDGTWAHPVLACAYAGYLSPKLEVEVREVWLRCRAGDATLADDILERASPEANEWAATRAIGRATRSRYLSAPAAWCREAARLRYLHQRDLPGIVRPHGRGPEARLGTAEEEQP